MDNSSKGQDSCDKNSTDKNCEAESKVNEASPENIQENKKEILPISSNKVNDLESQFEKKEYSDCQNGLKEMSLKTGKDQEGEDFESEYEDAESDKGFDSYNEGSRIKAVSTILPKSIVIKELPKEQIDDMSLNKTTYSTVSLPADRIPQQACDIYFTYDDVKFDPTDIKSERPLLFHSKTTFDVKKDGMPKPINPDDSQHDFCPKQVSNRRGTTPLEKADTFKNTPGKISDVSRNELINRKTTNTKSMPVIQAKSNAINFENKSDTNSSPTVPSDETVKKIIANVESYFIDFNILKNNFLLKHIRKNKEGFVSLKLITSFRKIRNLTKDWRVVAQCLAKSKMLELNADKNKVRRIQPIPKIEDTSFGKTIIVFNLPPQYGTNEQLKELFEKFGNTVSVEIMTPKSKNFNLYHKRCLSFNQKVASKCFGVVEFDQYESVQNVLKDEEGYLLKENTMSVVTLVAKFYKQKPKVNKNIPHAYNFYSSQDSSRTYFAKRDYSRDNYNSYNMRYNAYNANDEIPRRKFPYEANNNNQWYFRRLAATKNYSKELDPTYKNNVNILEQKCVNCGRVPEMWHQNRQLKANTSFNIERRVSYSGRRA